MPHGVLDVVAEHPQEDHVAEKVQGGAVQEHAGDERQRLGHEGQALGQSRILPQHRRDQAEAGDDPGGIDRQEPALDDGEGRDTGADHPTGGERRAKAA